VSKLNCLREYYRIPEALNQAEIDGILQNGEGFFRLSDGVYCFGSLTSGSVGSTPLQAGDYSETLIRVCQDAIVLSFDPDQAIENLLSEKYVGVSTINPLKRAVRVAYYLLRPLMGVSLRRRLQRISLRGWNEIPFPSWPVDTTVDDIMRLLLKSVLRASGKESIPFIWFWPRGYRSCVTVTHDVESRDGLNYCNELMNVDDSFAVKSSFQLIPEGRYQISESQLRMFRDRGFEVNVHDLNHDGHLFDDESTFLRRVKHINRYGAAFGTRGFRAGVLYRKQEWFSALEFSYDMSVPNVAHLDPQKGGCCSVFPYSIGRLIELPLTTIQDYSLFNILEHYSTDIWREQCRMISDRCGLMSFNVHPDYVRDQQSLSVYHDLLTYVRDELVGGAQSWLALPGHVADWWRIRNALSVEVVDGKHQIVGEGRDIAMLAFAHLDNGELVFSFDDFISSGG